MGINVGYTSETGRFIGGDEIPRTGLKLWLDVGNYDSYTGTGTAWRDMSGNNNDVTLVNANILNGHMDFDGTGDYAWISNLNYGSANTLPYMTTCVWFKTSASGGQYDSNWALLDFDRSEVFNLYIREDTGKLGFSFDDGGGIHDLYGDTTCNDGEWHFGCITYDKDTNPAPVFYLDGEQDGTQSTTGVAMGTSQSTRYGCIGDGSEMTSENGSRNSRYYNGNLDILLFYETVLSADQIKQLYNVYRGRFGL